MNRILFVSLCLIGILSFVLISSNYIPAKKSHEKLAKQVNIDDSESKK